MFFGIPVAVIIIVNSVFFFLTIYNIRRLKTKQKKTDIRRFSRSKTAADKDVKFYIQIGFILGFTWIIGFFLTTFSASYANLKIVYQILTYLFIILNALTGVFIFFVFLFKKETLSLYLNLFSCFKRGSINSSPSRSKNSSVSSIVTIVST